MNRIFPARTLLFFALAACATLPSFAADSGNNGNGTLNLQITPQQLLQAAGLMPTENDSMPTAAPENAAKSQNLAQKVDGPSVCDITISKYNTVDLHVQNVQISTLLQELAVKSHKNIILAAGADRVVSMTMYSVPFKDVLDVVMDVNGLGFFEENDIIKVFTKEQLRERAQGKSGMVSRFIRLNYMRAKDAEAAVKSLLSPVGKIGVLKDDEDDSSDSGGGMQEAKTKTDDMYKPEKQSFVFDPGITVYDYKDNVDAIEKLLAKIDRRPKQVLIQGTILSVALTDDNKLGFDFTLLSRTKVFGDAGKEFFSNTINLPANSRNFFAGGLHSGAKGFNAGFAVSDVGLFVEALNQITDTSVLARPKVLTLDRQRSKVLLGHNKGYVTYTNGQPQVNFIEDGISLDVRAYVMDDGKIRLVAAPKYSDVTFKSTTSTQVNTDTDRPVTSTIDVPTEAIQTVIGDVLLEPGATAVIGGLFYDETKNTRSQTPVIGDLPVIGNLARTRSDSTTRKELIFLLTPTIVNDCEIDDIATEAAATGNKLLTGQRQGLLPWSRVRQSEQLHKRALNFIANKQDGLGEWTYRRSRQADKSGKTEILSQPELNTDGILEKAISDQINGGKKSPCPQFGRYQTVTSGCDVCESAKTQSAPVMLQETVTLKEAPVYYETATPVSESVLLPAEPARAESTPQPAPATPIAPAPADTPKSSVSPATEYPNIPAAAEPAVQSTAPAQSGVPTLSAAEFNDDQTFAEPAAALVVATAPETFAEKATPAEKKTVAGSSNAPATAGHGETAAAPQSARVAHSAWFANFQRRQNKPLTKIANYKETMPEYDSLNGGQTLGN